MCDAIVELQDDTATTDKVTGFKPNGKETKNLQDNRN